jgi:CO/xanthine dehydrogenase Mo-binding subunit
VACLREGARRFAWEQRDPAPRARRDQGWLVGTGVAASTYPVFRLPGSVATIRVTPDGRYAVSIGAADIGTGTWTALIQIAPDALEVDVDDIDLRIGDTALPMGCANRRLLRFHELGLDDRRNRQHAADSPGVRPRWKGAGRGASGCRRDARQSVYRANRWGPRGSASSVSSAPPQRSPTPSTTPPASASTTDHPRQALAMRPPESERRRS